MMAPSTKQNEGDCVKMAKIADVGEKIAKSGKIEDDVPICSAPLASSLGAVA